MDNYKLISLSRVDSTQTRAHQMIASGRATHGMAIMADVQTAGRGRYNRKWVSNTGNLYISFIFDAPAPDARLAHRVAVAIADAIESFGIACEIKWPNDILIDGAKVCGVLIEYVDGMVIVGIGINIASAPDIDAYATTYLCRYADVTRTALVRQLMRALDIWRTAQWDDVRAAWIRRAFGIGRTITYRGVPAEIRGMDIDGGLILAQDGVQRVVYGDEIILGNAQKTEG